MNELVGPTARYKDKHWNYIVEAFQAYREYTIETPSGDITIRAGNFIVNPVNSNIFGVCTPEEFIALYKPVEEEKEN